MSHLITTQKKVNSFINGLIVLVLTFSSLSLHAQNITMTDGGNDVTCSGTFLDPGGTGNYAGGDNTIVHTICSATPGEFLLMDFTSFDLFSNGCIWGASVDRLYIYDGPNTTSTLIGSYRDNELNGQTIVGSSGCLTFRFVREDEGGFGCSDNNGNPGWSATISCVEEIPPTGDNCVQANPFCSDQSYNFPNSTGGTAPSGPNYGCLNSQPRPIWYYLKIGQAGTLELGLSQTSNGGNAIDVDFAMWGPFSDVPSGCSSIMSGSLAPLQCSYSPSATETIGIGTTGGTGGGETTPPAAQVGEYYIVILTNFDGAAGNISLDQTGGTGATDCSIIEPCNITNVTATPGTCDPSDNSFSVTGEVTFLNAPSTGDLIVEDCNGNSATYSAPFTSPLSYTISGITSDNATCSVTAYFSDEPGCTETSDSYQNPPSCACIRPVLTINELNICAPNSGDLSDAIDPSSDPGNISYYNTELDANNGASQDQIGTTVTTSGSYWIRAEMIGDPTCFNVYEVIVDVIDMDYTVAASDENCGNSDGQIELTPTDGDAPFDFSIDNGVTTQANGTFTGLPAGIYNITVTDNNGCTVSGSAVLDNIIGLVIDQVDITDPSCNGACDGEVSVTTSGGTAPLTFEWTDNNGNPIGTNSSSISNLCSGTYGVVVTDDNNCTFLASPILDNPPLIDASFELTDFCVGSPNAATNVITTGGTFSFNPSVSDGASIDASTGEISNAVGGTTYDVEYTTPGACPNSSIEQVTALALPEFTISSIDPTTCGNNDGEITLSGLTGSTSYTLSYSSNGNTVGPTTTLSNTGGNIVIYNLGEGEYTDFEITNANGCTTLISDIQQLQEPEPPAVSAPDDIEVCMGESVTLTADNPDNATITWSNGVTDGVAFTTTNVGATTYYVAASENGCTNSDSVVVTVNPIPNSTFTGDQLIGCVSHTVTFTDNSNLTDGICTWDFGDGETSNVCDSVVHTYTETGIYDVTLIVENTFGCIDTTSMTDYIEVINGPVAAFTANPVNTDFNNTEVTFNNQSTNASNYTWDFGDLSSQVNDVDPIHDFPIGVPGEYTVTLYAYNNIGCVDSTTTNIIVINPILDYEIPNIFTPNGDNSNDFFELINPENIVDIDVIILNRWGNLVFESTDANFKWNGLKNNNGTECSDGTYFYKINMTDLNGEEIEEHGFVQLSRQ